MMLKRSSRVCVVHPRMGAGGSEAVVMALLETLQGRVNLTLLTGAPLDMARLNAAYQTNVDPLAVAVEIAPMPRAIRRHGKAAALRGAFVERHVRRVAGRFDLCIGAYNFAPFGRPAIQLMADFSWDDDYRMQTDARTGKSPGLLHRQGRLRGTYLALCRLIAGGRFELNDHRLDAIVANSYWTADLLRARHGVDASVIYPPVNSLPFDPARPRSQDFVMLGRITPEKRLDEGIELLARVRKRGHDVALHIVGPHADPAYSARLRDLAARHGDWVRFTDGVYGDAKFSLLARHSFALHMMQREAFGIAVAEQVKMGMIPFVRAQSGPAEIVGEAALCFTDSDHGVDIIDAVLRDKATQRAIAGRLAERGRLFSKESFALGVMQLLESGPRTCATVRPKPRAGA